MNFETNNPNEAYGRMDATLDADTATWPKLVEQSAGPEIIRQVNASEITAEADESKMFTLFNSKQEH